MDNERAVSSAEFHEILSRAGICFPRHILRGKIILEPRDITIFELELAVTVNDVVQLNDAKDAVKTETKRYKLVEIEE